MNTNKQVEKEKSELGRGRYWLPISVFAIAIGYYLYFEHRAHIPGDYIFAIFFLVLCGGMHFFMHGGHGHGHDRSAHDHHADGQSRNHLNDKPPSTFDNGDE